MKKLISIFLISFCFVNVNAQNFKKIEYFIDAESGVGNAYSLSFTDAKTIDEVFEINIDTFSVGLHQIYIRIQDSTGIWSTYLYGTFEIQDTTKQSDVVQMEYYFDEDVQTGKMLNIPISKAATINKTFTPDISTLDIGIHTVHTRTKNKNGNWSPYVYGVFEIQDTTKQRDVVQMEYYFDEDIQTGKMVDIPVSKTATINKIFTPNISALDIGIHTVHTRTKNKNGNWSPYVYGVFEIQDTTSINKIKSYRYVIDSSLHNGLIVSQFNFNTSVDSFNRLHSEKIDSALSLGRHFFRTWIQDENNKNSTWHFDTFTVIDCPMLDTASIKTSGSFCYNDSLKFHQDITKFGIWSKDSFNFKWYINNTILSTKDSFVFKANSSGNYQLKFEFTKKTNALCKGSLQRLLTIHPTYNFKDTFTLCNGDSIIKHGKTFKTQGTFTTKLNTIEGCDSTWITKININPVYIFKDTFTFCDGDSIIKHGKTFKTQGTFTTKFNTIKGCDSTWITKININPVYIFKDTFTLCNGDSITKHGKTFKSQGTFTNKFNTIKSCDSTWITKININPIYTFKDSFTLCNGDSILKHGKTFKNQGTFNTKFTTTKGCDSTWITQININPVYIFKDTFTLCNGDSIIKHGKTFKTQGTYTTKFNTTKFNTIKSCDSTWITKINVNPTYNRTIIRGLCGGDSILFNGLFRKSTGTYIANLKTFKNCDSIVTLKLTVDTIITVNRTLEICNGDSIKIGNNYVKNAGLYIEKLIANKGCDSFTNTLLLINFQKQTFLNAKLCANDSMLFNGNYLKVNGNYTANLKTYKNCDSTVHLSLIIADSITKKINLEICEGDSILSGNTWKKTAGSYVDILKAMNGCDSFLFTSLKINPNKNTLLVDTICFGDNYNFFGNILTQSGTYLHTLNTQKGCDSTLKLTLFRRPQFIPRVASIGLTLLSTDTTYKSYQWYLNRSIIVGENKRTLNITKDGIYDVAVKNEKGCSANSWDNLLSIDNHYLTTIKIYPNPAQNNITILAPIESELKVYNNLGQLVFNEKTNPNHTINVENWIDGVYYFLIRNNNAIFTSKIIVQH